MIEIERGAKMEYVKREDVLRIMRRAFDFDYNEETAVENLPTADVVEVVRCKECVRNADNGGLYDDGRTKCPIQEHYALLKDGFCHLGERKEQEHEQSK